MLVSHKIFRFGDCAHRAWTQGLNNASLAAELQFLGNDPLSRDADFTKLACEFANEGHTAAQDNGVIVVGLLGSHLLRCQVASFLGGSQGVLD